MNKYLEKIATRIPGTGWGRRGSPHPDDQLGFALDKAKKLIERKDPAHARYKIQSNLDRLIKAEGTMGGEAWVRGTKTLEHLASSKGVLDTLKRFKK